jgi:hypothetical protein
VAAWDFAVAAGSLADDTIAPSRKFTQDELMVAVLDGLVRVLMRRGRYAGVRIVRQTSALLSLLARLDRSALPGRTEW